MKDIWNDIRKELRQTSTSFEYLNNIGETIKMYPEFDVDSLSKGQLYSKLWLIKKLKKIRPYYGNVYLLGGWYAIIAEMLFNNMNIEKIYSFDLDESCGKIADEININYVIDNWKFKSFVKNINELDFGDCNTVINTSSEHIKENTWFDNIPKDTLVVIQSNNLTSIKEHVNCVNDLDELKYKYKLSIIYYQGELDLVSYKRFMIIGIK